MKTLLAYARLAGLLLCLLISAISPSSAGTNQWSQIGPQVASLSALVIDPTNPSIIYTASGFNIYKSIDGGSSWSRLSEVPNSPSPLCYVSYLAIPQPNSAIYASTCGGTYMSNDGGISWVEANGEIRAFVIIKILPHPTNASVLYFINHDGLYRITTDGTDLFYISAQASNIIVDPVTPSKFFIAGARGVYKSTDSGDTWNLSNTGLPGAGVNDIGVKDIQISGGVIYVATAGYGIYKSVNGGSSWSLANSLNVSRFVIGAENSTTIYAANTLGDGIYRSIDGGTTWLAASNLIHWGISVNPQNPSSLFAAAALGFAKSTDGASTWSYSTPSSGLPLAPARVVGVDASNPDNLYAVGFPDYGRPEGPYNYRSSDKGVHWSSMGLFNGNPVSLVSISKNYPGVAYGKSASFYSDDSVYKSVNYGLDWTKIFTAVPYSGAKYNSALDVATAPGVILIAGQHCIYGLCNPILNKSSDNGATWVDVGNGVPGGDSSAYSLTELISDPSNPNVFYVGGSFGVYKTINGGGLWGNYSSGLPAGTVSSLVMAPANTNVLYAVIGYSNGVPTGSRVYKSTDGAVTWSAANAGLPNNVTSLAVDSTNPSNIYAATNGGGVFRSTNGGAYWSPVNSGLSGADSLSVNSIVLDAQGRNMFIGTNAGAYSYIFGTGAQSSEAIEFYKADINHYFITAYSDEAAFLDNMPSWGWVRTGKAFNVWLTLASAPGSAFPVCRFYGVFANGTVGSHFYTVFPDECAYVKGRLDWSWASGYEGYAFYAVIPTGSSCPSGYSPIYRVYNNGMGGAPNHRYMTSQTDVNTMVSQGWVSEGTAFCGAQ